MNIETFAGQHETRVLQYAGGQKPCRAPLQAPLAMTEVVVPDSAPHCAGVRPRLDVRLLLYRHNVTLVWACRVRASGSVTTGAQTRPFSPVTSFCFWARIRTIWLRDRHRAGSACLPLASRSRTSACDSARQGLAGRGPVCRLPSPWRASGWLYLPIALGCLALPLYVLLRNVVPLSQIYESVEWPVIVLLGSLIPDRRRIGIDRAERRSSPQADRRRGPRVYSPASSC